MTDAMRRSIKSRLTAFAVCVTCCLPLMGDKCPYKPKHVACGTFSARQIPLSPGQGNARFKHRLDFRFDPSVCGVPACSCTKVVFAQALRMTLPSGQAFFPDETQENRAVHWPDPAYEGWALDRKEKYFDYDTGQEEESEYGYVAVTNRLRIPNPYGETDWPAIGSNATSATATDAPGKDSERNYKVEVMDAAVCIEGGGSCQDKYLGYYSWGFEVQDDRLKDGSYNRGYEHVYTDVIRLAVDRWNHEVGDSHRRPFPPLSDLVP